MSFYDQGAKLVREAQGRQQGRTRPTSAPAERAPAVNALGVLALRDGAVLASRLKDGRAALAVAPGLVLEESEQQALAGFLGGATYRDYLRTVSENGRLKREILSLESVLRSMRPR